MGFRIFIACLLLHFSSSVLGQNFPSEVWHPGTIVLADQDTLKGEVKYDLSSDMVQIEINGRVLTFSAKKLFFFEIDDVTIENYRQFYVLPYEVSYNFKAPVIFEVVIEGRMTLLCREKIVVQNTRYSPYATGTYSRRVLDYDYYVLDENGGIVEMRTKKKDVLTVLKRKEREIKQYISANNLHVDKKTDLARIIAFYNGLL